MSKLKTVNLLIISSILLLLNLSCNNSIQQTENTLEEINTKSYKVSPKDIEQLKYTEFALSNLTEKHTKDWLKFQELQNEISQLKKGNLSFFKDDKTIIQSLITDLKKEIPEALDIPSILVRLSVLETTIFKLEGISNIYNVEKRLLLNAIKDILIANSNVILQMNKKFEKDSQKIEKPQ